MEGEGLLPELQMVPVFKNELIALQCWALDPGHAWRMLVSLLSYGLNTQLCSVERLCSL